MSKKRFLLFLAPLLLSFIDTNTKELALGAFVITVPNNWVYVKQQGVDSFVGIIKISLTNQALHFDFSNNGYANSLIPTEQEYLKKEEWKTGSYFYKVGVIYTADFNVKNEKVAQMKRLNTTDSTSVHVEADPSYQTKTNIHLPSEPQKRKFPKADYIADLTYKDSIIYVPIEIPVQIKSYHIKIDSTGKYIVKTIWPKVTGKGMTGIYIHSRSSNFNFQMTGVNLSAQNQELALKAFKTITFKK
ncbi:MAG: hypothetical protein JWQ79_3985 [Mucilaginibacter sp.]|nr:hypothetical protein [Mucilaginibacter sp.]